jgi:hypothetical protein
LTEFDLASCRYQSRELILASGLRPCGISVGRPKFPLGYTPLYLGELAPYGLLGIEDGQEFSASYIDRLGSVGVEVLAERFAAIVAEHQTRGLVFLCFEPVGQNCHRICSGAGGNMRPASLCPNCLPASFTCLITDG